MEIKKITMKHEIVNHRTHGYDETYTVTPDSIVYTKKTCSKSIDSTTGYSELKNIVKGNFKDMLNDLYMFYNENKDMDYYLINNASEFYVKIEFADGSKVKKIIDLLDFEHAVAANLLNHLTKYKKLDLPLPEFPNLYTEK